MHQRPCPLEAVLHPDCIRRPAAALLIAFPNQDLRCPKVLRAPMHEELHPVHEDLAPVDAQHARANVQRAPLLPLRARL